MPGRVARLGQCRIQAPHRGCVAQSADRQARPVLQPALPVPRRGRAVAAAAAERLSDRPGQTPHRVPVQMRRPRHERAREAQARRRSQHGRAAGRRVQRRSRLEARRRAGPRGRPCYAGADLPARRRVRHRRDRDPERPQSGIRDGGRPVREGRRRRQRARHRRQQRGGERRGDPRAADRPAKSRRVLHLRLKSSLSTDEARGQGRTAFPGKLPWSRSWPAGSGPATSACAPSRWMARRNFGACASKGRYSICRRQSDGRHEREDRERDPQEPDHARVGVLLDRPRAGDRPEPARRAGGEDRVARLPRR